MNAKGFCCFALLAAQTILVTGCMTSRVWEPGQFARFHEPADLPNLQLFYSNEKHDVLVEYTECLESGRGSRRRAFWLERNTGGMQRKPKFVSIKESDGLEPIPVVESPEIPVTPSPEGLYAIGTNRVSFTLYGVPEKNQPTTWPGNPLIYCELPVYADISGRVRQILHTPPAVVIDATIVGGVIAAYTAPGWWQGLNCSVH